MLENIEQTLENALNGVIDQKNELEYLRTLKKEQQKEIEYLKLELEAAKAENKMLWDLQNGEIKEKLKNI